ncbi:MAG TPA: SBBP repeat-containing protein, partial [Terriglobales bacterium]
MMLTANRISKKLVAVVFRLLLVVATGFGLSPLSIAVDSNTPHDLISGLSVRIQNRPLAFEPYAAQNAPRVQFVSRTPGYTVFLEPRQATIAFTRVPRETDLQQSSIATSVISTSLVRLRLRQSNFASAPVPEEPLRGKTNYLIGNDPAKWRTNVSLFGKVRYPSVYKDVDLVYYGSRGQLEYDFIIRPGGEPQSISFSVDGASHAEVEHGGDLLIQAGAASVVLHRPVAYQIIDTRRREVSARFLPLGGHRFGIRVAQYDRESPLIIDPVLAYSTYLGGSGDEGIFGISFDTEGSIYVAGETSSVNFPQKGGVQSLVGGSYDAFVSKFDAKGANLIYSTYLGGSRYDHAVGIQADKHGNVYVAGVTQSSDFPVKNAWQSSLAGTANGFVAQLNPSGSELVFSTYLGGTGFDQITDLALDRENAVYVAGSTNSLDFPITTNAFQTQCDGGAHTGLCIGDAFVAKFARAGRKLVYSTYLGGTGYDSAAALAVDERGEAYITGQTGSSNFPTKNPYQGSLSGGNDAFVTKLNAAGSGLVFSTLLGGTSFD